MIRAHTSYIVCATPRSGSSLLCEALWNTFLVGRAEEYFNRDSEAIWRARHGISSTIDYLRWIFDQGTSPNGVLGAKIMWDQMAYCVQLLRQLPDYQHQSPGNIPSLISTAFPSVSYVWIRRSDKVRQAVSIDIAAQTGNHAWIGDHKPTPQREPIFDFNRIDFHVHRVVASELHWQQYFTEMGVAPFEVVYEQFVERYEETTRAILDFLGIHVPEHQNFSVRPKLKKMADALNEDWVRRYHEIKLQQPADNARIRERIAQWFVKKPEPSKQNNRNRLA